MTFLATAYKPFFVCSFVCFSLGGMLCGCSHPRPTEAVATATTDPQVQQTRQESNQTLSTVQSMSPEQRQQYFQSNPQANQQMKQAIDGADPKAQEALMKEMMKNAKR